MTASPSNFWSRRRAAVEAEEAAIAAREAAEEAKREAAELARSQEEKPDEVILAELGLRDPDEMGLGDDFSAFMQRAVPERLRRRALRRLWRSNPVLANLDGLVDFGEDYTDAATVVPDLKTSYQVGKGLMQHVLAMAEPAEAPAVPATPAAPAATAAPEPELAPRTERKAAEDREQHAGTAAIPADGNQTAADPADPQADALPLPRRHMRFAFET